MSRTISILRLLAPALAVIAAGPAVRPVAAAEIDHAREYETCMTLARRDAEQAWESALAWRDLGGGDAADHCAAVALIGLKLYGDAATRLEDLAQRMKVAAPFKARLLEQAGQAWLLGDQPQRAEAVLGAALTLVPDDPDLLIGRAEARAAMQAYWDAIDDLNRVLEVDPDRPDALVFRASAYRFVDAPDLAMADVEQALALDPDHSEGLLERGILRRLAGDTDGARADWLTILRNKPGTAAARAAQTNIEKMDLRPEAVGTPPEADR